MEEWKDIKGYEGLYQISNLGRVKSLSRKVFNGNGYYIMNEKILKPKKTQVGYLKVRLCRKDIYIHRLVAESFIPNSNNYPEVNHKDESKTNNRVDNLEWCTHKYNLSYGSRKDYRKHFCKEYNIKTKGKKVICLNTNEVFISIREAARTYKTHTSYISKACKGIRKTAGKHPITGEKLMWKYVEEVTSNA